MEIPSKNRKTSTKFKKEKMGELKYSKKEFEGYTHRFIVKLSVDDDWRNDHNITVYSNSDDFQNLEDFINRKKSDKVISFRIEHRATKEQDELTAKFIEATLKYW